GSTRRAVRFTQLVQQAHGEREQLLLCIQPLVEFAEPLRQPRPVGGGQRGRLRVQLRHHIGDRHQASCSVSFRPTRHAAAPGSHPWIPASRNISRAEGRRLQTATGHLVPRVRRAWSITFAPAMSKTTRSATFSTNRSGRAVIATSSRASIRPGAVLASSSPPTPTGAGRWSQEPPTRSGGRPEPTPIPPCLAAARQANPGRASVERIRDGWLVNRYRYVTPGALACPQTDQPPGVDPEGTTAQLPLIDVRCWRPGRANRPAGRSQAG